VTCRCRTLAEGLGRAQPSFQRRSGDVILDEVTDDPEFDRLAEPPTDASGSGEAIAAGSGSGDAVAAEEEPKLAPGLQAAPVPPGRNEDVLIPEVFRDTIPPPPRGWTEEEWRRSFLGSPSPAPGARALSLGKGWLLAVVFGFVAVVVIVLIIVTH